MSFLLWQREAGITIASARLVLRADEVPPLREAQALRDELDSLRREQQAHVDAARDAARAEGLALGREQGRAEVRDELAARLLALDHAAAQQQAQLRADVAALALQVTRKLIGAMAADERFAALACVAAREVLPAPRMSLFVHPQICDAVRMRLTQLAAQAAEPVPAFDVAADEACAPEDCRIETELGSADASLDCQLARLAQAWGIRT